MTVDTQRMKKNLDILRGLLMSESVMIELGKKLGKQAAHEIVYENATKTIQEEGDFKQELLADDRVNQHLTEADIDRLLDPEAYIGLAPQITRETVALSRKEREESA